MKTGSFAIVELGNSLAAKWSSTVFRRFALTILLACAASGLNAQQPTRPQQPQTAAPAAAAPHELEITSLTAEPGEIESGGSVMVKYEFMARNIPSNTLAIADTATVSGPMPAPVMSEYRRSLTNFQHQGNASGGMDGGGTGGDRIVPAPSGSSPIQPSATPIVAL